MMIVWLIIGFLLGWVMMVFYDRQERAEYESNIKKIQDDFNAWKERNQKLIDEASNWRERALVAEEKLGVQRQIVWGMEKELKRLRPFETQSRAIIEREIGAGIIKLLGVNREE